MLKKRIQKFQNPGGGIPTPGTQNNGFSFSQQLSYLQAPSLYGTSTLFSPQMPSIGQGYTYPNTYANAGDPAAMTLRANHNANEAQKAVSEASKIENPFTGEQIKSKVNDIKDIINKPTTFKTDKNGNRKPDFASSKAGKATAIAAQVGSMAAQFIPDQDKDVNDVDSTMKQIRGVGQQALVASGNPILMAIGAGDMFIDKLGGHSDASQGLGTGTDIANAVASFVPGAGWLAGKTEKYTQSEAIKNSSSYTGEVAAGEKVARNAGARLLFGRGKANSAIRAQKRRDRNTEGILADAKDAFQASNYGGISLGNQIALEGGIKPLRAKQGIKLDLLRAREILNNYKEYSVQEVVEVFREGGKVNVIPSGQLHKNKHHMEDIGDEYKDLTTKGIPVVTESEGGELVQQAEIERDEIIFNIDVTKKLEELMKDGSDEAALEAGKLLAVEIMENTVDNTGLMKEIS